MLYVKAYFCVEVSFRVENCHCQVLSFKDKLFGHKNKDVTSYQIN